MIRIFTKACELPYIWDNIFENNHYMHKNKLAILEECNPCNQRYFIINNRSAFVMYKLKLNMFTFSKLKFYITVNIIGVPCSVSKHGYVLDLNDISEFEYYIRKQKKNCIILNAEKNFSSPLFVKGETLPTCKLNILWDSFDDFKLNLRSHYRYRLTKALNKSKDILIEKLENNNLFNEKLYSLYENVYQKSQYKLEKLSIDFFKRLPSSIYVFYAKGEPIAFVQLTNNDSELFFLFGGINYLLNHKYDSYMNMIAFILRHGIENKYSSIDMGQTAEDTKMKFGCSQYKKYMHIYHPNPIIRFLIRLLSKKLSYRSSDLILNLFNDISEGKLPSSI